MLVRQVVPVAGLRPPSCRLCMVLLGAMVGAEWTDSSQGQEERVDRQPEPARWDGRRRWR